MGFQTFCLVWGVAWIIASVTMINAGWAVTGFLVAVWNIWLVAIAVTDLWAERRLSRADVVTKANAR